LAQFHRVPGGEPLSNATLSVIGDSITIGLRDAKDEQGQDLILTNDGNDLAIFSDGAQGASALFKIRVTQEARSTRGTVSDRIYAVTSSLKVMDSFRVEFSFRTLPAHDLVVRDVTKEVYGVDILRLNIQKSFSVDMTSFVAGDPGNVFNFVPNPDTLVSLQLYAAKLGSVERTYWLMLPLHGIVDSVMVVISHGFGQNDTYYSARGYSNPFSRLLLDDVKDRFVVWRWGIQVAASRTGMGLLMPVRARAGTGGGTELGPFVSQAGIGTRVIHRIAALANADFLLNRVGVVTFSSGIHDANTFVRIGGKGLSFKLMVNQDPVGGLPIASALVRKQYLSGWTTGGPRPDFEFMPDPRWKNDPYYTQRHAELGREYLHTWAMPTYTLGMALRS
jgi:hypothetical protein